MHQDANDGIDILYLLYALQSTFSPVSYKCKIRLLDPKNCHAISLYVLFYSL